MTGSDDHIWYTYDGKRRIANEEFLGRLYDLGYDKLVPCSHLYENMEDASNDRDRIANSREALDDFVSGKIDALYSVEGVTGILEKAFVMRSYEEFYDDIIMGDALRSVEYVDFDNDGENELGYARLYGKLCFF